MKKKTAKHPMFPDMPRTFNELNRMLPLRPIHDDIELDNATEIIDVLAVNGERLNKDQADYLYALSTLTSDYEKVHYAKDLSRLSTADVLVYLVESNNMTASALGELLGQRSLGSKLLRGEREPSKAHIRILAERFKVAQDLFNRG